MGMRSSSKVISTQLIKPKGNILTQHWSPVLLGFKSCGELGVGYQLLLLKMKGTVVYLTLYQLGELVAERWVVIILSKTESEKTPVNQK